MVPAALPERFRAARVVRVAAGPSEPDAFIDEGVAVGAQRI